MSVMASLTEVADRLAISPETARRLANTGELPVRGRKIGKQWRFIRSDLDSVTGEQR